MGREHFGDDRPRHAAIAGRPHDHAPCVGDRRTRSLPQGGSQPRSGGGTCARSRTTTCSAPTLMPRSPRWACGCRPAPRSRWSAPAHRRRTCGYSCHGERTPPALTVSYWTRGRSPGEELDHVVGGASLVNLIMVLSCATPTTKAQPNTMINLRCVASTPEWTCLSAAER
jgi:hypothetical protein